MRVVEKSTKVVFEVEDREDFFLSINGIREFQKNEVTPLIENITSLDEYQKLAARTLPNLVEFYGDNLVTIEINIKLNCNNIHAFYGIDTEFGEILDLYKKSFAYRKVFDRINLIEEICDIVWYCAASATINNESIEEIIDLGNIGFKGWAVPVENYPTLQNMADAYDIIHGYRISQINIEDVIGVFISSEEELFRGLTNNINKLICRYPDKFSNENALNRDLDSERKQLEQ